MGRLQDWWTRFWERAYHLEMDGPLTERKEATPPGEAELVIEVEGADELSAQMEELAQRLRDMDWGQVTATGGFASDALFPEDTRLGPDDYKVLTGTFDVDEEAVERMRAKLEAMCAQPNRWADLFWLATECGDAYEPSFIEVGHTPMPRKEIPVELLPSRFKVVGASVCDSLTPLYDPAEHKTLDDIQEEAQPTAMGLPMALFSGECRWWTTNIADCFMDSLSDAECACKRPCCPHCGEPLVMVPLSEFIDRARQYPTSFGDAGLRALELAYAANLGCRMCLNEWDYYVEVADSYVAVAEVDTHAD